jgi:hypothetical protein
MDAESPIRPSLKMQSKEMPRVLQDGLAKKKLKSKGQKRRRRTGLLAGQPLPSRSRL